MFPRFLPANKGSTLAEYATLASLLGTLSVVLSIGLHDQRKNAYEDGMRDLERLQSRIVHNCLTRTRASDTISAQQADEFNCFHLDDGDDRITLAHGDNLVYPGPGRNVIIAGHGTGDTQVTHQRGQDIYHFRGGRGLIDLRSIQRNQVHFDILRRTKATALDPENFDPSNPPASDILLRMPDGSALIAGHLQGQPATLILFSDVHLGKEDIARAAVEDQLSAGSDQILGTPFPDMIAPGPGNDSVLSFEGDDIITYGRGHDRYDAGAGQDLLEIPGVSAADLSFSIEPGASSIKIEIPGRGTILLLDQAAHAPGSPEEKFSFLCLDDQTMTSGDVLARAIKDQGTAGSDRITGSRFPDRIHPGTGENLIYPDAGSDIIHHEGGHDVIHPAREESQAIDVLDLGQYARDDIVFSWGDGDDLEIRLNDGSSVTVKDQFSVPAGQPGTNIEIFRLKDEDLEDDIMRKLFFSSSNAASQ